MTPLYVSGQYKCLPYCTHFLTFDLYFRVVCFVGHAQSMNIPVDVLQKRLSCPPCQCTRLQAENTIQHMRKAYVCIYICMCVYMRKIYVCMYICIHVWVYVCCESQQVIN